MKKRIIILMLVLLTMVLTLSSCDEIIGNIFGGESAHECESVCPECGKCLDVDCTEDVCRDKCTEHGMIIPPHECESVCPECGKCTNKTCKETACAEKCVGHTASPAHECESICPECGKCADAICGEAACENKCQGHKIEVAGNIEITLAEAGFETIYFEWKPVEGADGYVVYCDTKPVDNELIRSYGTYYRCDVLGLAAVPHSIEVVPVQDGKEITDSKAEFIATPMAHVREGYAFVGGDANGAYNADGTLKSGAQVVYVTAATAKTCTATVNGITHTGFQSILDAKQKYGTTEAICFRVIGLVKLENLDHISSSAEGLQVKGKSNYNEMNITIEGVGNDATFSGFGILVRNTKNVEIRNLGFMNFMDDGISVDTNNSHLWIHNCDFFYGKVGSDSDQAKGDGSLDTKKSQYITYSFNHFFDSGKVHLVGNGSSDSVNYLTFHHNWYDHADSRMPRVRGATVHVYNNFYDGVSKYGIGATMGASIFSENNYFLNTSRPMSISMQGLDDGTFSSEDGGIIKAFGNVIIGQNGKQLITYSQNNTSFDYYDAKTRDEKVPASVVSLKGGHGYSNFDTAADMYSYNVESAEAAMKTVKAYAGRVQGGDFKWTFTDKDNTDYEVNSALKAAIQSYKSSLVSIGGIVGKAPDSGNGDNTGTGGSTGSGSGDNSGSEGGENKPTVSGAVIHIFEKDGTESSVFSIKGNLSTSKGTATYKGVTYKKCLKIESEGKMTITFTTTEDMTLILVFGTYKDATIKINGEGVDAQVIDEATTTAILTYEVKAGVEYTLTRNGVESCLFCMELVPKE